MTVMYVCLLKLPEDGRKLVETRSALVWRSESNQSINQSIKGCGDSN